MITSAWHIEQRPTFLLFAQPIHEPYGYYVCPEWLRLPLAMSQRERAASSCFLHRHRTTPHGRSPLSVIFLPCRNYFPLCRRHGRSRAKNSHRRTIVEPRSANKPGVPGLSYLRPQFTGHESLRVDDEEQDLDGPLGSESHGRRAAVDRSTPLTVLTKLNCGRPVDFRRSEEDSISPFPSSSASVSVPISAVRQTPLTRRLLSPNSVTARFSKPKHPYLTEERRAVSSSWTSPAAMTSVDRAPTSASSRSLQSDSQQDQAAPTFPISPLVMTSPTGMRRERRKAAPSWPDSPRGGTEGRSARDDVDLDSPGYLQTPSILRNIPPPTATPTHKQFLHTPVTAGYASPFFSSAPPLSNARGEPVASSSKQPLPSRDRKRQEGIPKSYFVKSLHNLAPSFWNKPATADCRVRESPSVGSVTMFAQSLIRSRLPVIPIRGPGQMTPSPTQYASFKDNYEHDVTPERPQSSTAAQLYGGVSPALVNTGAFASTQTEDRPGTSGGPDSTRKVRNIVVILLEHIKLTPPSRSIQLMTFNLHRDYLISQSALFQELLEGKPQPPRPAPSHQNVPPSAPSDISTFARSEAAGRSSSPRRQVKPHTKGARVLHTPAHVPTTVWLPLPDPGSFAVLAHVLYW